MTNLGSMKDWRQFPEVFADVPGLLSENISFFRNSAIMPFVRLKAYQLLQWYKWAGEQRKVALLRAIIDRNEPEWIRTSLVTYLLVRGDNFLFSPQGPRAKDIVDWSQVETMQEAIGKPTGALQEVREPDALNDGFRLYSRRCRNGIVYLNMTGKQQTITLPTDAVYKDRSGQRVESLALDDLSGDYVLREE
jgi:hypothetical protein